MRASLVILASSTALAGSLAAAEIDQSYPGAVALGQNNGEWGYKSFPGLLPLYIFEGDEKGKSNCDKVCAAVWPIVRAPDNAKSIGDWTIVEREDGRRQWAYKGKPAYTFYDDEPNEPKGIGLTYGWWLDEAFARAPSPGAYEKAKSKTSERAPAWRILEP